MVGTLRKSPPMDRRPSSCLITKLHRSTPGRTISISREPHCEQTSRSFQSRTGGSCAVKGGRRTRASRRSASVERFCANAHLGDYHVDRPLREDADLVVPRSESEDLEIGLELRSCENSGSQVTPRWSKRDSNPQSPVARRGQTPRRQIFRKRHGATG